MSSILFTNISIADASSPHNGKKTNILFDNGVLTSIGNQPQTANQTIDADGYFISPGWIDTLAFCGEPGEEWKESIVSLSNAAQAGGFTKVAACCGNHPVTDTASAVSSIFNKGTNLPTSILPIGAITIGCEGKEMAELFDMQNSGAVAFFDGDNAVSQSGIKSRILEYANNFKAPVYLFPFDKSLAYGGSMHEGVESTRLGLKGIPTISEATALLADIELATWLKTPLRVVRISSAESVKLIRKAKADGLEIYASVPVLNLLFTDADLNEFDENYKVLPPLRTSMDRDALVAGVLDGTIDAVCSNHSPQDSESKDVEFDYSAYGASTIQTAFSALLLALGEKVNPGVVARVFAFGPAKILGLDLAPIEAGSIGNYTIFSLTKSAAFNLTDNASKSKNNPLLGQVLPGEILGIISNGECFLKTEPLTSGV